MSLDYGVLQVLVYTDAMTERGFLEPDENRVLRKIHALYRPRLLTPDLLIYLNAEVDGSGNEDARGRAT